MTTKNTSQAGERTHWLTSLRKARLIAAAPDMLGALEFVRKFAVMRAEKGDALPAQLTRAVEAAIAKATRGEKL